MRTPAIRWISPAFLLVLTCLAGCGGLSGTNVGEPTPQARSDFSAKLKTLEVGMPADSLEALFEEAHQPGDTGILHKAKVVTTEFERVTYSLGWKSDPRHQIGVKEMEEIDVEKASVTVVGARVVSIKIHE